MSQNGLILHSQLLYSFLFDFHFCLIQVNQRFAVTLLGKMGHTVMLAENGQEAVDKWRATLANLPAVLPFDICLMDLSMPVCHMNPF